MKKLFIVVLIFLLCSSTIFAGGAVNKNNFSAGYLRTLSKNTETEKPDATFYNPAGTAFMADGIHIAFDNQFVIKDYTTKIPSMGLLLEDKEPTLFYPSASLVWKMKNFAIFANFGVVSGGGTLKYDSINGEFSSMVFGETIGVSYRIFDMLSAAVAVKLTHGSMTREMAIPMFNVNVNTKYEQELSLGWIASVHVRPLENLDISAQYQSQINSKMELKGSDKQENGNLPAMIGAGIGYRILKPFYASLSFNYYFNEEADYDYDNTWEIGLSLEYDIIKMLSVSLGVLYTDAGHNDKANVNSLFSPILDSVAIGGGVELRFLEDLKFDIAIFNAFYFDDKYTVGAAEADSSKNILTIGVGASYRF